MRDNRFDDYEVPMVRPAPAGFFSTQKWPILVVLGVVLAMMLVAGCFIATGVVFSRRHAAVAQAREAELRQLAIANERRAVLGGNGLNKLKPKEAADRTLELEAAAAQLKLAKLYLNSTDESRKAESRAKGIEVLQKIIADFPRTPAGNEAKELLESLDE